LTGGISWRSIRRVESRFFSTEIWHLSIISLSGEKNWALTLVPIDRSSYTPIGSTFAQQRSTNARILMCGVLERIGGLQSVYNYPGGMAHP
jgi:hypothetical protein